MSGLVLKDFLMLRKSLKIYAGLLAVYLVLAVFGMMQVSFIASMMTVIIMVLPLSAFSWDELARWDRYAMSLPLGRRRVVGARYLTALLLALCAGALGLVVCVVSSILDGGGLAEGTAVLAAALTSGLVVLDLMLPLVYKLGHERARPWLLAIVFAPIVALAAAARFGVLDRADFSWIERLSPPAFLGLAALFPALALAGFGLSFLVSCRIAEGKEY